MNAALRQKEGDVSTETNQPARGRLIALCGLKGSGKSTAAQTLAGSLPAARIRFAGPLKDMLRTFGLDDQEIEGDLKEVPSPKLCGKTPRHAMVTLGTEWGRDLIGESIWVDAWRRAVEPRLARNIDILTEDLRFPNEYEAVRALGGIVVRVTRPGLVPGEHESERHALKFAADVEIYNDGDLEDLCSYCCAQAVQEIERALRLIEATAKKAAQ